MIAGRLDTRIEAFERVEEENALGERVPRWESRGVWRAERVSLMGSRSEEAGEHFADYRARYSVRSPHRPAPGWRVAGDDGLLYEVTAVEPNRRRGMLTIDCQRVNL